MRRNLMKIDFEALAAIVTPLVSNAPLAIGLAGLFAASFALYMLPQVVTMAATLVIAGAVVCVLVFAYLVMRQL